jgi:hypothetical protein
MKRIAILLSGEYRKFDVTRKTMPFLDSPGIDIYFSTWDKTEYLSPKINFSRTEHVSAEKIITDLGRAATIRIDFHESFKEVKYNSKMINRWKAGFELIISSGIEYDYIIIMRPDIFFTPIPTPELINLERFNNSIGFAWATSLDKNLLPDVLFMSSTENMAILMNALSVDVWANDNETNWHLWWYKYVNDILPIQHIGELSYLTFCRYWAKPTDNFMEILDTQHDWRDLRLLHEIDLWGKEPMLRVWPSEVVEAAQQKWINGYFNKYL